MYKIGNAKMSESVAVDFSSDYCEYSRSQLGTGHIFSFSESFSNRSDQLRFMSVLPCQGPTTCLGCTPPSQSLSA